MPRRPSVRSSANWPRTGRRTATWAADGDPVAFDLLVRRHQHQVWSVCLKVLGHTADAEDVFQTTFLNLWVRARSIQKPDTVACWLYGVADRTARKLKSTAARRRTVKLMDVPAARDWGQVQGTVFEEVLRLPAIYRDVILLRYLNGLDIEEAALALGIQPKAAQKRLNRGIARLGKRLSRQGIGPAAVVALVCGSMLERASAGLVNATIRTILAGPTTKAPAGLAKWMTWLLATTATTALTVAGVSVGVHRGVAQKEFRDAVPVVAKGPRDTLAAQNLRHLKQDVIPKVLEELRSIPGAGDVKLVSCDAYDTRVEVVIEGPVVRVLSYDASPPYRARFLYDTADGWKRLQIRFHKDDRWTTQDADRPLTLPPLPVLGCQEHEVPLAPVERAWAAFGKISPDERMEKVRRDRDQAMAKALTPWYGTWLVKGRPGLHRRIREDMHYGCGVSGPGLDKEHRLAFDPSSVDATGWQREARLFNEPIRLSANGLEITFGEEVWQRAEYVAAGCEAVPPRPGRDLSGEWLYEGNPAVKCYIVHHPNGLLDLANQGGGRTTGVMNGRGEIHTLDNGVWSPSLVGTVEINGLTIRWINPVISKVAWTRATENQ